MACRTGVIFLRFSGERGQARDEREVRDTRDGRGAKKVTPCVVRVSHRRYFFRAPPVARLALARLKNAKKTAYSAGYIQYYMEIKTVQF